MKASVYTEYGGPDVLRIEEVEKPNPKDDEVLIKIHAASVNDWDWGLLRGKPFANRLIYSGLLKPKIQILGCDIAGEVELVGRNVKEFHPGDEVLGDISGCGWGGFAEYVCARSNAVVLKPTPEAPLTAYKFAKLFIESEFAIEDALSVVYGDVEVGSTLVESMIPRVLSFTGSVPVGNIITKSAGIKKVSLELGGNAATFIDRSADVQQAAARCAFGAFINSGQVCISLQRIYVDETIYDAFANALKIETEKLVVGSPYDDDTFIGPLINEESLQRANSWVQSAIEEGATCLTGNKNEGLNYYPTVMTNVTDDMKIVCEEVFAPIVSLVAVKDYSEAIDKMNNSPYGLQFSIFSNDLRQTKAFIDDADCGGVVINDIPTLRFDIQPYGGNKLSGIGKEGPKFAIEEFTEIKSVVIC